MSDDAPTLREFLEQKISCERELREMESRVTQRALDLQAVDYKRHFEDLNHARAQQMAMLARTVPRENWEQRNKEIDGKLIDTERRAISAADLLAERVAGDNKSIETRIAAMTMASSIAQAKSLTMTKIMGGLVVLMNLILAFAMYFKK